MDNTNTWISNIPLHFGALNRVFSQPCRQCPSDWWHAGEVMLQFPQVEVHCCPKYPTEHSGKETYRLNLNVFHYFRWVFLISRHCFSTVRNKPNSIYKPVQKSPVQCPVHPFSHRPVKLLQGVASLQWPSHTTQCPFTRYVPLLQTVLLIIPVSLFNL